MGSVDCSRKCPDRQPRRTAFSVFQKSRRPSRSDLFQRPLRRQRLRDGVAHRAQTRASGRRKPRPAPPRPALMSAPMTRAHFVPRGPRGSLGFLGGPDHHAGSPTCPAFLCSPQAPAGAAAVPLPPVPCPPHPPSCKPCGRSSDPLQRDHTLPRGPLQPAGIWAPFLWERWVRVTSANRLPPAHTMHTNGS